MSWIWCLAVVAIAVDLTPSEPRAAAIKVFFNERLGPLEIDRMGLGQGGLSDEPMWDNRVPEIRALHPRLIRLFIQEYFNLFPKRDQYQFEALDRSVDTILKTGGKPLMCMNGKTRQSPICCVPLIGVHRTENSLIKAPGLALRGHS